jgi:nucleoside-diphosphate-sugar epimerase
VEIDLEDTYSLQKYLINHQFDSIIHIGALRGGRKFSNQQYSRVNILATEELCKNAKENNSRFIFCSSVGIFGAIPSELPATNETPRRQDNYYHYTKIEAEKIIQAYVRQGLDAVVVRPAIVYGIGDYGFPHTLIKLVDKKIMFLPDREVRIHLTNISTLVQAFLKLIEINITPGTAYIIADKEPVILSDLVDFIENEIRGQENPGSKKVNAWFFDWATAFFKLLKNELWVNRLELISQSWYYDTYHSFKDLAIEPVQTIPAFKDVVNWYKELK